ncbi:MAG: alpha-amylase family glycosyl hydrolase [Phormidesmis sp.]
MGFKKYASIAVALMAISFLSEFSDFADISKAWNNATASSVVKDEPPTAIYHAFNQNYADIENYACGLAGKGYSHLQISPAQRSNPGPEWWKRYQPYDLSVIEGLGSEDDLRQLISTAHSCDLKIIADVVFNHMANLDGGEDFEDLSKYPNLTPEDFHTNLSNVGARPCSINYSDGNRDSEMNCWLGGLPDLKFTDNVKTIQKAHLRLLLDLGVDGFRFDSAKHMPTNVLNEYINYINQQSRGNAWNYLEVINDDDTIGEDYSWVAAVSDFVLYNDMKEIFTQDGDLRSLPAAALDDSRSITFGNNHDTMRALNVAALNPYSDVTDSYLATAYVLARESGTPLIFSADHAGAPFIKTGVKFRQIIKQREKAGAYTRENILRAIDDPTILLMERGTEGFFIGNKGIGTFDIPTLDLTLSTLEGCYVELRNNFSVAIEQRDGKKYVTRWGTWERGGIEIRGRDALYFVRASFDQCQ